MGDKLRVLVACEFSGTVRDAFIQRGHEAISCDFLPTEAPGPHYQGDVFDIIGKWNFDLMIAHPPCNHLAVSGARWFKDKVVEQAEALEFVQRLLDAPIHSIALENPVSVISTKIRKPDQIVHPWQFGDAFKKTTCWWLKNLPLLVPTNIVEDPKDWILKLGPSPDRAKKRSVFFKGMANTMAEQWGRVYEG